MNDNHIALLSNARLTFQNKQFPQAYQLYLQVIKQAPGDTAVLMELGQLCATMGRYDEASNYFQQVIELEPGNVKGCYMNGALNLMKGDHKAAIDSLQKTLRIDPNFFDANKDLGLAFYSIKQYEQAAENFEIYLKHVSGNVSAIYNFALVRRDQHQYDAAVLLFRQALLIAPNSPEIHNGLGYVLHKLNNLEEAEKHFRISIKNNPEFSDACFNLGAVLFDMFRFFDAEETFLKVLQLNPQHERANNSLANVLLIKGDIEGAEKYYRKAASASNSASAHSNLLLCMHYRLDNSRDDIFNEHKEWCAKHITKTPAFHDNKDADAEKILRIGYVSANFCQHSVAYFIEAIFRYTNQSAVNIYCYSDTKRDDAYTATFKKYATKWREVSLVSNTDLAKQIEEDNIDILVDIAGHTDKGCYRLNLFALKSAPIQVTYLGYPDTTGLNTIDYRLTDRVADPSGSEEWHSESLAYLESGFLCYTPPGDAPDVALLPAMNNNYVTFGSFNNHAKVSPETLDAWIKILQRVPGSRLMLKSKVFFDPKMIEYFQKCLSGSGIDESRFDIIGWTVSTEDHLALYDRVDIGLDPFPYNGTTTTCESLWMGVPVIALLGDMHCSRVGASILTSVAQEQLIATSIDNYIDKAVELANDLQGLSQLRSSLRNKVINSDLNNGERFVRQLESCYRDMWRKWCQPN